MNKPRARMYKFDENLWYAEMRNGKSVSIFRITWFDGGWFFEDGIPFVGF